MSQASRPRWSFAGPRTSPACPSRFWRPAWPGRPDARSAVRTGALSQTSGHVENIDIAQGHARVHEPAEIVEPVHMGKQAQVKLQHFAAQAGLVPGARVMAVQFHAV